MIRNIVCIVLGGIGLAFVGIKHEPEFGEIAFFIKHKPDVKFNYFSPSGDSDTRLQDLPPALQAEEIAFRAFVGDYYKNKPIDPFAPFILLLACFLLLWGSIKSYLRSTAIRLYYIAGELVLGFVAFVLCYWVYERFRIPGLLVVILFITSYGIIIYLLEKSAKNHA